MPGNPMPIHRSAPSARQAALAPTTLAAPNAPHDANMAALAPTTLAGTSIQALVRHMGYYYCNTQHSVILRFPDENSFALIRKNLFGALDIARIIFFLRIFFYKNKVGCNVRGSGFREFRNAR